MSIIPRFFGGRRSNNYDDPFAIEIWDPFFPTSAADPSAVSFIRVDWVETPEAHIFKADIPGLNKEQVKVEVEEGGRVLKISGEGKKEQEAEKDSVWHRLERGIGNFFRRFRLPENTKTDQTKANMENGVLTVTIPKEEKKKPEARVIEICG